MEKFDLSENEKAIIVNLIVDKSHNEFKDSELPFTKTYVKELKEIRSKLL